MAGVSVSVVVVDGATPRNTFAVGTGVTAVASFTDNSGAATVPSDPAITFKAPDFSIVTYGVSLLSNPSTGVYQVTETAAQVGAWIAHAACTQPSAAVAEASFDVVGAGAGLAGPPPVIYPGAMLPPLIPFFW